MTPTFQNNQTALPVHINGPTRLQDFYAALQHSDYAFMWNMLADNAILEFPGTAVGGTFNGRDVVTDRFIGLQLLVNNSLQFTYRWVGKSFDGGDYEILEFSTTAEIPINGVNRPYSNRGSVITIFNENNKIVEIHDYMDTVELLDVVRSDNQPDLQERVRQTRAKAGLPPSVYQPQSPTGEQWNKLII